MWPCDGFIEGVREVSLTPPTANTRLREGSEQAHNWLRAEGWKE